MQLHDLQRNMPNKGKKIVGRGGKRGTYSGRGIKGQLARAGRKLRPELRDIIKKLPKKRGYFFRSIQPDYAIVKLADLEKAFNDGEKINPKNLTAKGLVEMQKGRMPRIKILGGGTLTKKLSVEGCALTKSAKAQLMEIRDSYVK